MTRKIRLSTVCINWLHHLKTAEEQLWQITLAEEKNAADGQAKSVNDGKKWMCMNLNKKSVKWWEMPFCLLKQYGTIGAFIQYCPFVYFAFIMATRPETLDCPSHALLSNEQRYVFLPVRF